tara:strand:+ start:424 stop:603 length:180 start_codon:yes stop_codon:yes gene_type:complete
MDLEINNQKDFYDNISIDEFDNVLAVKGHKLGIEKVCKNQFDFFKSVKLDENGNLKIYK